MALSAGNIHPIKKKKSFIKSDEHQFYAFFFFFKNEMTSLATKSNLNLDDFSSI